jgi:hypothetical protein
MNSTKCKISQPVHVSHDLSTAGTVHVFSAVERSCVTWTGCEILHFVFAAVERSCETCTGWEILHFVLFLYFYSPGVPKMRWVSVIRNVTYSLTYVYVYVTQWFNHLCIIPCFPAFSKVVAVFSKRRQTCLCTIHVFSAVERSCERWTGWEILHFVLFMYFQLTQDHARQAGICLENTATTLEKTRKHGMMHRWLNHCLT